MAAALETGALILVGLLGVAVAGSALRPRDELNEWPMESWRELAQTMSALGGGGGNDGDGGSVDVWAPYRGDNLAVYRSEKQTLAASLDLIAFASGSQFLVASANTKYPDERVDAALIDAAEVVVGVRQKAGGHQLVALNPRAGRRAVVLDSAPKPGTSSGKTFLLRLQLPEQAGADDVLYLHAAAPIMSKPPIIRAARATGAEGEGTRKLRATPVGRLWAVELRRDIDLGQPLEVVFYSAIPGELPPGFVAWLGGKIPADSVRALLF